VATAVLALRASQKSSACQPRQPNLLRAIFRRHYAAFAESYLSRYASHYGRFRLARITKVSEAFIRCGDYRHGVARLQCSNPECHSELFRPFACQSFHLCPSCPQKRTLLFAEFLSHRPMYPCQAVSARDPV